MRAESEKMREVREGEGLYGDQTASSPTEVPMSTWVFMCSTLHCLMNMLAEHVYKNLISLI